VTNAARGGQAATARGATTPRATGWRLERALRETNTSHGETKPSEGAKPESLLFHVRPGAPATVQPEMPPCPRIYSESPVSSW
jgi:hypothetical protein